MGLVELFVLAVGLSMDAFAVAVCKGLCMQRFSFRNAAVIGLYFGVFQAGMPLIGYFLGTQFAYRITAFDHWIAFFLLGAIGIGMIRGALSKEEEISCEEQVDLRFRSMVVLAVATSIDALAVGVSLAFLRVDIVPAVSFIGAVTFLLSVTGVAIGHAFGTRLKSKAELTGGIILMAIGTKILLEHLGVLG